MGVRLTSTLRRSIAERVRSTKPLRSRLSTTTFTLAELRRILREIVRWFIGPSVFKASSTANCAKVISPGRLAATRVVRDHVARQSLMKAPKALICSGEPCSCMSSRVIPDMSVMSTLSPLDNYFWQELLVMCRAPNMDRSSTSFRFSAAVGNFDKHSVQGLGVNKPVLTPERRRKHIALLGIAD